MNCRISLVATKRRDSRFKALHVARRHRALQPAARVKASDCAKQLHASLLTAAFNTCHQKCSPFATTAGANLDSCLRRSTFKQQLYDITICRVALVPVIVVPLANVTRAWRRRCTVSRGVQNTNADRLGQYASGASFYPFQSDSTFCQETNSFATRACISLCTHNSGAPPHWLPTSR